MRPTYAGKSTRYVARTQVEYSFVSVIDERIASHALCFCKRVKRQAHREQKVAGRPLTSKKYEKKKKNACPIFYGIGTTVYKLIPTNVPTYPPEMQTL